MKKILLFTLILSFTSLMAQEQFENASFEEWESVVIGEYDIEPVNWSSIKTSDSDLMNGLAPVVWQRSDEAKTGNYSLYLKSKETLGIVATGTMVNGRLHADLNYDSAYAFTDTNDSQWNSAFTSRPDSVIGWFMSNPTDDDFPTVKVALHTGELRIPGDESNIVAMAYIELPIGVHNTWTRFSAPFIYSNSIAPEYHLTILTAGDGVSALGDSEVWFDDMEFVYNPESINENKLDNITAYYSNGSINVLAKGTANDDYHVTINDLMGRQVYTATLTQGASIKINADFPQGVYIVKATHKNSSYSRKIIVD